MLKSLHVTNFALIDNIEIEFQPGLNIITGETGAGKSILIDALGSAIGEKIPVDAIRKGSSKTVTECIFSAQDLINIKEYLRQNNLDDSDNDIILRKESSASGRNRSFVNDSPTTNSVLYDLGNLLVDLHGQHEHQALLKVNHHIKYLDDFGNYQELLSSVENNFDKFVQLLDELNELKQREKSLTEKKDLYQFQKSEIENIDPYTGEEDELQQEEKRLGNSEKLYQLSTAIGENLYDAEDSIYDRLSDTLIKFEELTEIDSKLEKIKSDCESTHLTLGEIAKYIQSYSQSIEFNPERLEEIRERLGLFTGLKRKYTRSIDEIIEYKNELDQELQLIENLDAAITEKQNQIESQRQILTDLSIELSTKRKSAAENLDKLVLSHLNELGMKNARFRVNIDKIQDENGAIIIDGTKYKLTSSGIDKVEFFIAANPGEDLKPLAKVASGGEISRVMLALKSSLARADKIPVLIFDEIDNGISGRIAQAVGISLKRLSKTHQIICITHLPQIASVGDTHFVVEKTTHENLTRTQIRKLAPGERALEIAKLLGGEVVTETHINSARELIAEANQMNPGSL